MNLQIIIPLIVIIAVSILWLVIDNRSKRTYLQPSFDAATKALDKLSAWTIWICSLETAAIGGVGFLYSAHQYTCFMYSCAFYTLLFFGVSILLAAWLLCSLPSIQMRLTDTAGKQNDIYEMDMFQSVHLRFGSFSTLVHTYFVLGIISFTMFIYAAIHSPLVPSK